MYTDGNALALRVPIIFSCVLITVLGCGAKDAKADSFTFTIINVPGAVYTTATGINNSGQIVGSFLDQGGVSHGFLRSSDGSTYTSIDDPSASNGTHPYGINASGQISGMFIDNNCSNPIFDCSNNGAHGFLRNSDGSFTNFDVAGAFNGRTLAYGINSGGEIVGIFNDSNCNNPSIYCGPSGSPLGTHGFLRSSDGSSFTTINTPGAVDIALYGINASGQIAGYFSDLTVGQALLRNSDGSLTTFVDPSASTGITTTAFGINASGQVVGSFYDGTSRHAFLRNSDGSFTNFDVPGAFTGTEAWGINDSGQIVGIFNDATGEHGFLASPTTVPEPSTLLLFGTVLFGIGRTVKRKNSY